MGFEEARSKEIEQRATEVEKDELGESVAMSEARAEKVVEIKGRVVVGERTEARFLWMVLGAALVRTLLELLVKQLLLLED